MAITQEDIKLFQAQDNTDNDSGGGSRTSNQIADGAVNNLFPDISRIDTVGGDVSLRKVFPVVNTDNRDIYYGAHAMLRRKPTDPLVSALLFHTDDPHDDRAGAQNKIEAYVVPSYRTNYYLFGGHIAGSKTATFLLRFNDQLPSVGEVYYLKDGADEQYIRISDIAVDEITLTWSNGDYQRRRVIATLTQPLEYDFEGSPFSPNGQAPDTCDTFTTQIADAAKFYSTKALALAGTAGDLTIKVDSIYEQIVPSTTKQTPLVNVDALAQGELLVENSASGVIRTDNLTSGQIYQLPTPVTPNTFVTGSLSDDGIGNIVNGSGAVVGSIDYKLGTVQQTGSNTYAQYIPANVVDSFIQFTAAILVTQENQGTVFIMNVAPVPTGQDLYIDYRSNGRWYRIFANPDGTIGQTSEIGAGTVNNNGDGSASITVTLGALPDIDTTIIFSWGSKDKLIEMTSEAQAKTDVCLEIDLGNQYVDPSSVVLNYTDYNGTSRTLSTDAGGKISDATIKVEGEVNAVDGKLYLRAHPSHPATRPLLPSFGTTGNNTFQIQYNYSDAPTIGQAGYVKAVTSPVFSNGTDGTYDLGETVLIEGVKVTASCYVLDGFTKFEPATIFSVTFTSDSQGNLRVSPGGFIVGTVTAAGLITITWPQRTGIVPGYFGSVDYASDGVAFSNADTDAYRVINFTQIEYQGELPATAPNNFDLTVPAGDLTTLKVQTLGNIIGGTSFWLGSDVATVANNFNTKGTNVFCNDGTQVGTINLIEGTLEIHPQYCPFALALGWRSIQADLLGRDVGVSKAVFRTSATDLTTSSLILRYTTANGSYTATTDANGNFTGTDIDVAKSFVDASTGAVFVYFTAQVDTTSIKYDAVAKTSLPLDPELLGLNPVRLPNDGRVPVFDAGRFLVIYHEETTAITTPTAGATETLARSGQSYVEVIDVNGAKLAFDQYTADKTAGTVTFANPLTLIDRNGDPMTGPYSIVDRVEDMTLCTEAQVTGLLGLSAPLSRNYPADETRVASCLVWGDTGARYYNLFSQQSFDVWDDNPTTNPILAKYDDINYPIQIVNKDSVAGRWMVKFLTSTTVEVIEENLGVVQTSTNITNTNLAPINPATGLPYWTMNFNGFGGGWVTGNVIRFNTDSGEMNMWVIRTVKSGQLTEETDSMDLEIRGDAN